MIIDFTGSEPKMSSGKYEIIPPGVYRVCVNDAVVEQSKTGKAMVVASFVISEGAYKAKPLRHYFTVESKPGKNALACLLKALTGAVPYELDTTNLPKLLGKECLAVTYVEVQGGFKNTRIQSFHGLDEGTEAESVFMATASEPVVEDVPF
jgi:hypothetical protein